MADAMKAVREGMQQEAADELVGRERHDLVLAVMPVVAPTEADLVAGECHQPAVGDGDTVRIAPEIGQHRRGAGKRRFSILPIIPELESRFVTPTTRCIGRQPQSCA
jgi:D-aminopeptidase